MEYRDFIITGMDLTNSSKIEKDVEVNHLFETLAFTLNNMGYVLSNSYIDKVLKEFFEDNDIDVNLEVNDFIDEYGDDCAYHILVSFAASQGFLLTYEDKYFTTLMDYIGKFYESYVNTYEISISESDLQEMLSALYNGETEYEVWSSSNLKGETINLRIILE